MDSFKIMNNKSRLELLQVLKSSNLEQKFNICQKNYNH